MIATIAVACFCTSHLAQAQLGGLGVQFGGYGNGNGFYNSYGNGYRSGYGNQFYGNQFYGRFNNVYNGGYGNSAQPYNRLYPNFGSSYVAPYYYAPIRPFPIRRYRYR